MKAIRTIFCRSSFLLDSMLSFRKYITVVSAHDLPVSNLIDQKGSILRLTSHNEQGPDNLSFSRKILALENIQNLGTLTLSVTIPVLSIHQNQRASLSGQSQEPKATSITGVLSTFSRRIKAQNKMVCIILIALWTKLVMALPLQTRSAYSEVMFDLRIF